MVALLAFYIINWVYESLVLDSCHQVIVNLSYTILARFGFNKLTVLDWKQILVNIKFIKENITRYFEDSNH